MRKLLAALAVLAAVASPAHAQKTKAEITTEIGTLFPDNVVGAITPLALRTVTLDTVNSIMPTAPVVAGNLACFSGTTGLLQDCGTPPGIYAPIANPTFTGTVTIPNGSVLNTPASVVLTNATGTAAGLTAGNVTTNANLTGPVTSVGNATTIGANQVSRANLAQGVARSVIGVTGNATANVADIQGTANQALIVNSAGTALAFGQVNLASSAAVTGTLPIANGGTGDTGTVWATFTPTPTCGTATITTTSARSKTLGKTMWLEVDFTITALGSCTSSMTFSLPSVTAQSGGGIAGREFGISGKGFTCDVRAASAIATCSLADFTNFVNNAHMVASGVFEIQ